MKQSLKIKNRQQGFSLLEALLALFILTIGLLGVAAMHGQSMRTGYDALQQMTVISKGEEILERMRANPQGIANYSGAGLSYGCSAGNSCTPSEMAQDDIFVWLSEINNTFPGNPVVNIQVLPLDALFDPTGNVREVQVTINWTVRNNANSYQVITEIGP